MPNKENLHYKTDSMVDTPGKEELEPIVKFVVDAWDKWEAHWASRFTDFDAYYDQWKGKAPKRDEPWQAHFNKRLTWQAEKALIPRFHSVLFPVTAPIEPEPTEVEDELQGIISKSIVSHWFKIGMFSKEFLSSMRSAAIYGTGLIEDDWYIRTEPVLDREEIEIDDFRNVVDETGNPRLDEEGNIISETVGKKKVKRDRKRTRVVEDRYRIRKGNIYAWRFHPNKIDDDDDFPGIKQEFVTYDDLVELQEISEKQGLGGFKNMDKIEDDKFKVNEEDVERLQKGGGFYDKKNPLYEILTYWGKYYDEEKTKPMKIMIINRKYKMLAIDNPFWHQKLPVFHIIWTEDEKPSYYGIGLAEIGKDAEDRANNSVNVRTDIKKKISRGSGWYNALDKKIKKTQVVDNTPGLMRACSDVKAAVQYDVQPSLLPEDYQEEQTAVNDHREITGASNSLLPAEDAKQPDTLGGMKLLLSQSVQRLKPDIQMMEMMGIRRIANRAFLLTRQFYTEAKAIELVASVDQKKKYNLQKVYKITPEQIIGKVQFFSTGLLESVEKAQNIDKLLKYAEVTSKVPGMQLITNYEGIAKRIALWLGFEDVEDFVKMNPESPLSPSQGASPAGGQGLAQPGQPAGQGQGGNGQGLDPRQLAQIAQSIGQQRR